MLSTSLQTNTSQIYIITCNQEKTHTFPVTEAGYTSPIRYFLPAIMLEKSNNLHICMQFNTPASLKQLNMTSG